MAPPAAAYLFLMELGALEVAARMRQTATLMRAVGENPFRAQAYDDGARAIERAQERFAELVEEERLTELEGIGEALARHVTALATSGHDAMLDKLQKQVPPVVLELSRLPGLGPKRAMVLARALRLKSVDDLRAACEQQKVRKLKGFGAKTEASLLEALQGAETKGHRELLSAAREQIEPLLRYLKAEPACRRVDAAGSIRRWKETVKDADLIASADDPAAVMERFVSYPEVARVEAHGETASTVRLLRGLQVDLRVVAPEDHATALHHFTGSKAHNVKLRGLARQRGLTISEYGVHRLDTAKKLSIASEAELYRTLGMQFIPPELREDEGEIELAQAWKLPRRLLQDGDVRGLVHCHTTWSDGRATIAQMARAADELGLEYLTITDHSQAAFYANGLDDDALRRQWDEIDQVQETVKVKLLKGVEADVLVDGSLDCADEVLEKLDVLIASVHQRHGLDPAKATRRLVRAMTLPVFKIWGHPTGRLLLRRDPMAFQMETVLDAAAGASAAIEINGDPNRLDLEPRWVKEAKSRGLRFVVSVDAHSTRGYAALDYGLAMARRSGLEKEDVLNTLPVRRFQKAVRPVP